MKEGCGFLRNRYK